MATIFVASSKALAQWGYDVGLTKQLYKMGVVDGTAEAAVKALNETAHAGERDWRLVKKQEIEGTDEAAVLDRLARKETVVDPFYYPKIKGARGIFKVKLAAVERQLMIRSALEGGVAKAVKTKPADIGAYLIESALS